MSTQPMPQHDDVMALADAVGVTPTAHLIEAWHLFLDEIDGPDAPVPYLPTDPTPLLTVDPLADPLACEACAGTGMVERRSWLSGGLLPVTCPTCDGTGAR